MTGLGKRAAGESTTKLLALVLVGIMAILLGYALGNLGIKMMTSSRPAVAPTGPEGELRPPATLDGRTEGEQVPPQEEGGLLQTLGGEGQEGVPFSQVPARLFRVRVGPFADREKAQQTAQKLEREGYEIWLTPGSPTWIQVGAFAVRERAERQVEELKRKGYTAIIVQ